MNNSLQEINNEENIKKLELENTTESQDGKYVVIIVFMIISILMITLTLKNIANKVRKSNMDDSIPFFKALNMGISKWSQDLSNDYTSNYKDNFEQSIVLAKGSLIFILGLVTLIYQNKYSNVANAQTFFGNYEYRIRALIDMGVTALFGMLSTSIIIWSRGGNIWSNFGNITLVGIILALFNLSQEASGLNRYLAKDDTLNKIGPYYHIDVESRVESTANRTGKTSEIARNRLSEQSLEEIRELENNGDPFIVSLGNVSIFLMVVFVFYLFMRMVTATYYGYTVGSNNPFGAANKGKVPFFVELIFIVGALNVVPPILSPFIRKQGFSKMSLATIIGTFVIAITLQIMFQGTGMLKFNQKN
jgi:hypothetical protein